MKFTFLLFTLLGLLGASSAETLLQPYVKGVSRWLTVSAGGHSRLQTPVTFSFPGEPPDHPVLRTAAGEEIPVQILPDGSGTFILPELAAGGSLRYQLASSAGPAAPLVAAVDRDGSVDFAVEGNPVCTLVGKGNLPRKDIGQDFLRGGYLHPLLAPSGAVVTGDYPADHLHHHGIWTAWTHAIFQGRETDFWNMGKHLGKVDSTAVGRPWSGSVQAGAESENSFTDLSSGKAVAALAERWTVRVFHTGASINPYNLLELVSAQETVGDENLKLPQYHYGGIGIRGPAGWNGAGNAIFLTSEGVTRREAANSKPAKWIAMAGDCGGAKAGIAILGHPGNFRAPQPIRVHPAEPFISFAPQISGPMEIGGGAPYRSEYRFVLFDGEPDAELIQRLWNDYAEPPGTTWE